MAPWGGYVWSLGCRWNILNTAKESHFKFYKVRCQYFVSWSHNNQMLLDDGNRITNPQGNLSFRLYLVSENVDNPGRHLSNIQLIISSFWLLADSPTRVHKPMGKLQPLQAVAQNVTVMLSTTKSSMILRQDLKSITKMKRIEHLRT